MQALADWYREDNSPTGILQAGGGIAGTEFFVKAPMLRQDVGESVPLWSWFDQISESRPSRVDTPVRRQTKKSVSKLELKLQDL